MAVGVLSGHGWIDLIRHGTGHGPIDVVVSSIVERYFLGVGARLDGG
jgi:hypothetical protein